MVLLELLTGVPPAICRPGGQSGEYNYLAARQASECHLCCQMREAILLKDMEYRVELLQSEPRSFTSRLEAVYESRSVDASRLIDGSDLGSLEATFTALSSRFAGRMHCSGPDVEM